MTKGEIGSALQEKLHIEDAPALNVSVNDRQVFVEALIKPQPVNDRLRDTVRRYREATGV
ncbi:DUF1778 domain-containing protein [Mesorhizobium sp. B2-6-2]|uniref:type II toxin -antitoxin system TacA 1-like antitoxin n=1 Tax=Mesorhizobium sp. B2-6-2 TaxID=2589915 RepID=UPI00112D81DB|nr:DUF1778 domain-containing protein [Mesorhizobium sp. B2-6-2]TPJ75613.1 DUF1778 domain-containing protein [Mesorhizobium sp. B2-6-2]